MRVCVCVCVCNFLASGSNPPVHPVRHMFHLRAPTDCLQYFTGATGTIQSFNFAKKLMLQSLSYTVCIRQERGEDKSFIVWIYWQFVLQTLPSIVRGTPGNTIWRGRLSTVDLLIEVTCFVKWYIKFSVEKAATINWLVEEVNGTEPSPSLSFPWVHYTKECNN